MRQKLVAGNWKMCGDRASAQLLLQAIAKGAESLSNVKLAVFPPFVHLSLCEQYLKNSPVMWGAQNVSEFSDGAYTGEISIGMLEELGCGAVILGHSERRQLFGETDEQVAKKCLTVFQAGLTPIVCVGETLAERESGKTLAVVQEQLEVILLLKDNCADFSRFVIAYEPIWAIGTGLSATPEQAQIVHSAIREQLAEINSTFADQVRILYGGSVKPSNAAALFAMTDIDGALVGGASLDAEQFLEIGRLCNN